MNDSTRVKKAIEQLELIIDMLSQGKTDILSTCRNIVYSIFFINNQLADIFVEIFPSESAGSIINYLLQVCRRPGYSTMTDDIKKEIENFGYIVEILKKSKYYQKRGDSELKAPKVFISHSSKDEYYVSALVELLEDIGLKESQLFCSSIPGYGIPLDQDIYDYLQSQYEQYNLHIFFVLSNNYYESVASLNEMGAAWILRNKYTSILLPGFDFDEIKGAINTRKVALKLDGDLSNVKEKLGQLKDSLIKEFSLDSISDARWEKKRDDFISTISTHKNK